MRTTKRYAVIHEKFLLSFNKKRKKNEAAKEKRQAQYVFEPTHSIAMVKEVEMHEWLQHTHTKKEK